MTEPVAEILTIGSEVLAGDVLDTNSHWLCRQLRERGCRVSRITTIPDDPIVIQEALLAALRRHPNLVLTCGGLGPTADDLTLSAVADALGRPLATDPVALAMVRDFYALLAARGQIANGALTPARSKMARLPADSQPLANGVGAAPGVLLREGDTWIGCLPGVPAEMRAIFENELWPRLAAIFEAKAFAERSVRTNCYDESVMAPAVDAVAGRHPGVYVKSRAQVYGGGVADFVTLSTRADSADQAAALLDAAEADLREELAKLGIETATAAQAGHPLNI